jgi:hypothetical protein
MGFWQSDLDAYSRSALPALPGSIRNVGAIEQDALNAVSTCKWRRQR